MKYAGVRALVLFGCCLCLLSSGGCVADAEHSNPFDPLSDEYRDAGTVRGVVVDRLFQPVAGAQARLHPVGSDSVAALIAETGPDGAFTFDPVPTGDHVLRVIKEGYFFRGDTVAVSLGRSANLGDVRLDALPIVQTGALRTIHLSRWWPEDDLYLLDVELYVVDPDERPGIDSTWLVATGEDSPMRLTPGVQPGTYVRTLPADSLSGSSVHALVGASILARIRDREGKLVEHPLAGPVRVVEETPIPLTPQGLETVNDPRPTLTWDAMSLPFQSTYRIEVIRDEVNTDFLVQEQWGISADTTSFRLTTPLSPGSYYWTVAVVDAHGNLSRSKEAGFRVN